MNHFEKRMQDLVTYRISLTNAKVVPEELLHLRNAIIDFIHPWVNDYLWHLEDFRLQCNMNDGFLHGATRFGDNIEVKKANKSWKTYHLVKQK